MTPTEKEIEFASLMCSRLCHDLISPVGALANGIEILADETDPDMRAQVVELLTQSAQVTAGKLQFFRLAFGAPGGLEGNIATKELKAACESYLNAGKATLAWQVADTSWPKPLARATLILVMLAAESLIRGGVVTVSGQAPNQLNVTGNGPKLVLDETIQSLLQHGTGEGEVIARYAPVYLCLSLAKSIGAQCSLSLDGETLAIRVGPNALAA